MTALQPTERPHIDEFQLGGVSFKVRFPSTATDGFFFYEMVYTHARLYEHFRMRFTGRESLEWLNAIKLSFCLYLRLPRVCL